MVTKYKIAVNGKKQQPVTQANNQIVQQLAQNAANQQLQSQAQAQAEAVDPMRQTVNDLLKTKLLNTVEMPRFTTVQDIINAPKGNKLETFGKYLGNNPNITRLIGTLVGGTYMDKNGNFVNAGEQTARRQEALMQADQQKALSQIKEQNDIATALNHAFLQQDIADMNDKRMRELAKEQLEFKKQENALDRQLEQQKMQNALQRAYLIHGGGGSSSSGSSSGGTATGGAASVSGDGLTPKQIQKNQEMLNSLNAIQDQMDRFSSSFGKVRGSKAGALLADMYASNGFGNEAEANFNAQRTLLFNKIARELGGEKGVLSDQDIKRIEASLPALSDSLPQKKAKMQAIYNLLEDRKSQYGGGSGASASMPNINMSALEAEMKRRGLK